MNEFSDIESALMSVSPVPCPVDPLDVMFRAGAEQEKLKHEKMKKSLKIVSALCTLLFCSTTGLLLWSVNLKAKNFELARANETTFDSQGNTIDLAGNGSTQGSTEHESNELTSTPEVQKKTPSGEGIPKQQLVDSTKGKGHKREIAISEWPSDPRLDRASLSSRTPVGRIQKVLMRGVKLTESDMYRDAIYVRQEVSVEDEAIMNSATKANSSLPYLTLRSQIDRVGLGL